MRQLVLLLRSGHTVRIRLNDDDLTDPDQGIPQFARFVSGLNALGVSPFERDMSFPGGHYRFVKGDVVMAYVHDLHCNIDEPFNEFNRIDCDTPGVVQYGD
jgi:hypothetical protein